jgi:hypothetical protein
MEDLINEAFRHIDVLGPRVAEGHYDLVGPNGDIILPKVWEKVIEPDWDITMYMWPIPENPQDADPARAGEHPADASTTAPEPKEKPAGGKSTWLPSQTLCGIS